MMKGNCLIIPKSLQAEMLEQIHKGHQHIYISVKNIQGEQSGGHKQKVKLSPLLNFS